MTNFVKCEKVSNNYGMFYGNSHLKDCFVLDCHFHCLQSYSSYSVTIENTFFFNTIFVTSTSITTLNNRPHTHTLKNIIDQVSIICIREVWCPKSITKKIF